VCEDETSVPYGFWEEGGVIVVKVGGSDGIDRRAVCQDIASLWAEDRRIILIHGANAETSRIAKSLGHPPKFVTSPSGMTSRFTDRRTLEIFEMVYCGLANKGWVEELQRLAVPAVGLSGLDGRIFEGRRKANIRSKEGGKVKILRGDHTGTVDRVNKGLLALLLQEGYLPVLTPPGASYDGEAINVDGDRAAAMVASELGASVLLLLSNVPGLLSRFPDEASLIPNLAAKDLDESMQFAEGRMKKKMLGVAEAIQGGVPRVVLGDARNDSPVSRALAGEGTVIE
jgi:acetylglutamate/LysW-gamma-L-alpha-aminoadipate kinase